MILRLSYGLYDEGEGQEAAVGMANLVISNGRRVEADLGNGAVKTPSFTTGTPATSSNQLSFASARVANNVAMQLKDADQTFSGDLPESWMEFVDECQQIARGYRLSPTQKLQYFHNILSKDAQRFYLDRMQSYATTFPQAVDMIIQEYTLPCDKRESKTT